MKQFNSKISLTRNSRGLWYLDPLLGCSHGKLNNGKGCYGVCYASNALKCRGYDFDNPVKRFFENEKHFEIISNKLLQIPFVRIGVNCDPSDDWNHSIEIIDKIKPFNKNIVIVTKHWNELSESNLLSLKGLFVNTSISIFDNCEEFERRLFWYNKLKEICHSILRVNTANFYDENLNQRQLELLKNENVIDNILRFKNKNVEGIKTEKAKFLNGVSFISRLTEKSYIGDCYNCPDLCGVAMFKNVRLLKPPEQTNLFDMMG